MFETIIRKLNRLLYPLGRAFKMRFGGDLDKMHKALAVVESQAYEDANSVLFSILPDNADFTTADAEDWERRLGIIGDSSTSLADRMAAIKRKYAHPGTIKARQNWRYVEAQLQAAGFNVWVHENRFPSSPVGTYQTLSPGQLLGTTTSEIAMYDGNEQIQYNQVQYGGQNFPLVANHIEAEKDAYFNVGGGTNLRNTFFIGGVFLPNYANVPAAREAEFRQLILTLKPAQTIAYLFINYV